MRARGPSEANPRQLRALVLLLALLPLIPTLFVVRVLSEDISTQRLEARERARRSYQKILQAAAVSFAANAARQLQPLATSSDLLQPLLESAGNSSALPFADSCLLVTAGGELQLPPPTAGLSAPAQKLAIAVIENGTHYAPVSKSSAARWRYLSENPEPLFALHPKPAAGTDPRMGISWLLLRSREHLRADLAGYFDRVSDPQVALRLLDENGEPLATPDATPSVDNEPLADVLLPAPLPAWRVQLFSVDASLIDGIAREQIAFYWWSVGGMFLITAGLAIAAGGALSRRIALHELSNDALAVVSHEMKTPLASTRLFVETLLEHRYSGGAAQADDYLRLIAEENARLERLVDGFQTLSRLEHRGHRERLQIESLPAGQIAREAAARLRLRLSAPNCAFTLEGAEETSTIRADRDALVTVLVNLLDNALKYSGTDKHIELRCRAHDGAVFYEVTDHGQGIDNAEQRRIFERFYQADRRLSRSHEGCGLGLSIVRSLVRAHRGTVSVQSKLGEGSTFTVRLKAEKRMPNAEVSGQNKDEAVR